MPSRPVLLGDTIPLVCGVADVARILGLSLSHVHKMRRQGRLRAFELRSLGGPVKYSGRLLQQWAEGQTRLGFVNGQLDRPRTFGRKRTA